MKTLPRGRVLTAVGLSLPSVLFALLAGCAVGVGGPYVESGYVSGYYEPYGYEYGGWGGGYRVAPPRGGERGHAESSHAYRAAPASHRTPSIPSRGGRPHEGDRH
jgi:hypothetical protein